MNSIFTALPDEMPDIKPYVNIPTGKQRNRNEQHARMYANRVARRRARSAAARRSRQINRKK